MEKNINNIDEILKRKFESFEPVPPPNIWSGIEKGISAKKPIVPVNYKKLAGALILLLGLISVFIFDPFNFYQSTDNNINGSGNRYDSPSGMENKIIDSDITDSANIFIPEEKVITKQKIKSVKNKVSDKPNNDSGTDSKSEVSRYYSEFGSGYIGTVGMKHSDFVITDDINFSNNITPLKEIHEEDESEEVAFEPEDSKKGKTGHWKIGLNLWPGLAVSNIDSVEILNSFNLSVEPTYFLNQHWFIKSGIGASYSRDRGFARIKYVVNEYMGSYQDVYNVTFDSIDGVVVPTYHTKNVEVWDSIQRVKVSNVTNRYFYLHVPLLFGYASGNSNNNINWHVFAGPVVFFKATSWIQEPSLSEKDATVIALSNNLPERNDYYFQLWVGAGINYRINQSLGLTLEPGYNYYLTDLYSNNNIKSPRSGFSLRLGLQIRIK